MAVTLSQSPPPFAFSGNFIPVKFETDNYIEDEGALAENYILFFLPVTLLAGESIPLKYGNTSVTFDITAQADDSGSSIPAGTYTNLDQLVPYFTCNLDLSRDFDIWPAAEGRLNFTAKKPNNGFDLEYFSSLKFWITREVNGRPRTLRKNFSIWFELYCQNSDHSAYEKIYEHTIPLSFDKGNVAEMDVADKLRDHLLLAIDSGPEIPSLSSPTPLACKKTCRKYYFRYAEMYGQPIKVRKVIQSPSYTVILGGMSYVGQIEKNISTLFQPDAADRSKDRFLKQSQGSISSTLTRQSQPQFLYFFNTRVSGAGTRLKAKWHFNEGGSAEEILSVFDMLQHEKYGFNVRFDKAFIPANHAGKSVSHYEIWLESSAGSRLSEVRTYILDYSILQYLRYFLFLTSWGAVETLATIGQGSSEYQIEQQEAARVRISGSPLSAGDRSVFGISLTDHFKVNTGWLTNDELIMLRDFILSAKKYRYYVGRLLPIALTSDKISEKDDANRLYKQLFEYKYLITDDAFTERSDEDVEPMDAVAPRLLPVYFGPSALVPATAAEVKALPSMHLENVYDWIFQTGTNNVFSIAVPYWKSLLSVVDVDAEDEDLLKQFKLTTIEIDGVPYQVYTMILAIPYSKNHDFHVIIRNDFIPPDPTDPNLVKLHYFGPATSLPDTAAKVKALAGSQASSISDITLSSGTSSILCLALLKGTLISDIVDTDAEDEDLINEYELYKTLFIDGLQYEIYIMQMAIAYSSNHSHSIKIKNG